MKIVLSLILIIQMLYSQDNYTSINEFELSKYGTIINDSRHKYIGTINLNQTIINDLNISEKLVKYISNQYKFIKVDENKSKTYIYKDEVLKLINDYNQHIKQGE